MTSVDSTTVAYADIGPHICVTPPYYALGDLASPAPGLAGATVPVQTPTGRQATLINIAEAGRHLAILGLVRRRRRPTRAPGGTTTSRIAGWAGCTRPPGRSPRSTGPRPPG